MSRIFLSIALILLSLASCTVPMYKPVGLGVPKRISTANVMQSIKSGVELAECRVLKQKRNEIIAHAQDDDLEVTIKIKYNPSNRIISFNYVDSKNMDYTVSDGVENIYFSYNVFLQNLEKQIALRVAKILAK